MNSVKQICTTGILYALSIVLLAACGGGGSAGGDGGGSAGGGGGGSGGGDSAPVTAAMPDLSFAAVKTFHFSWADVNDATHYKLLENADSHSGFTQVGSDIPQGSQSVDHVVPLYARLNAQYILQSCNSTGCTDSSSVAVSGTLVNSIGYVKASNTEARDFFGNAVALSADGSTLAVGAGGEDSGATDIGGDQADDTANAAGAVYVFSRDSAGVWGGTPAYIKASNTDAVDQFGRAVALSADGNTLAVGAVGEDSNATGIDGDQADNSAEEAGVVYVFSRDGAGVWGGTPAYIKASNTDAGDFFGISVALSADGNTLAVGADGEDSDATGIDGAQADNNASSSGAVYVFSRDSAGVWGGTPAYVKASNTEASDVFGRAVALSGDGNTLAVGAILEDSAGTNGNNNDKKDSGAVYVYSRDAAGEWSDALYIKASAVADNIDAFDQFGRAIALSADGNTLAVVAEGEASNATGIDGDQADNTANAAGAVYVFSRDSTGVWGRKPAYVKASNTGAFGRFGSAVALSADGNTLAVGATGEASNVIGIGGDQADNTASGAGALYVFIRDGSSWSQRAYVKASNSEGDDLFGNSAALSADGSTIAVGANGEASDASGIGGDQADNTASQAGAVYLY